MDIDEPEAPNGCSSELKVNGLLLHPVLPQDEGEGLPYAPINWPNPGDTWGWRVGKRTAISGYYLDRYLYLPSRLQKSRRGRDGFASKLSVEQYIQARLPGADVEAFFASFSWKIPSKQTFLVKEHNDSSCMLSEELAEASLSDCQNGGPACKAGSSLCPSLTEEEKVSSVSTTMFCDICCSEPSFCRECCCILCCKTIDFAFGGYSFIRCQAKANDGLICGHAAHLVCALRCYMAGTVPGMIALDAEYYCRRCDSRTELVEHVTKVFKICESVDSREDNKKMLNLVICLLRGSQRRDVKRLLNRAQLVLQKFESGNVSDIWILEDDISSVKKGSSSDMQFEYLEDLADLERGLTMDDLGHGGVRHGPSAAGGVELFHDYAEDVGDGIGDATGVPPSREKAQVVEVGDNPDPPLAKLKKKPSRSKKTSRHACDSSHPEGSVAYHLEAIAKGCRDALSAWGKMTSHAADADSLRDQVTRVSLDLNRMKTERDAALSKLGQVKAERDTALSKASSLQAESVQAVEKARAEGRQEGVDEYVAGYRMKARYTHHAAGDFFYGLRVGAKQVLNHYKLEPIRLNARDNAGVEYLHRGPYKAPAIEDVKGDHDAVLEAWGVTTLKEGDPCARKLPSSAVTSAGVKRTREGSPRGYASSALASKP